MVHLTLHANSVNIARRLTAQNENDLLQESYFDTEMEEENRKKYTRDYCAELASHLMHEKSLPRECRKYGDVVSNLRRRDTDTTHPTQWMS
mmetsp:Transcript_6409/g.8666  ORF Transcript_6409/g.8666 Transcript_6409/m.8666 type:complete len:91 (+) Transcript_6409:101-373(+)|eukprot:CAMPEP_0185728346 /NCGR_PEP_ID=MMETSP1171-20130828/3721_1 /TAXON_ID=374046 /ORGANISM="Helicotheca tamensis, Strain CCMP826" /LENGTH=90 /DNA_ID=CAMNT_0028397047 /DNA_START=91 /DNA_END=363 /DNA_ORIENTATION=+